MPTRIHGPIDYMMGLPLIAAPWIFGLLEIGAALMTKTAPKAELSPAT